MPQASLGGVTGPSTRDRGLDGGRRPRSRVHAFVVALLLAAPVLATVAGPPPVDTSRPATAGDCQSLLHQFDVAWAAHHDDARAAGARHSRDLGAASCDQKHYADGVKLIRRALHDIGVKPVKIVAPSPAH